MGFGLLPFQTTFIRVCLRTKTCTMLKVVVNATPVSYPETQIDARLQKEKKHREDDQKRNPHPSSF